MTTFTKKYQVEVTVKVAEIYEEDSFNDNLEYEVNNTVGFAIMNGKTEHTNSTTIYNGYNDGFQAYKETDVDITVNVVYHSLESIGE